MSNSFQKSVEYLFALGNEVLAMKLGLENVRKLLDELGRPQDNYLKVQVAGTNGKGSVCAFLNSICIQAEIKTGMFTSPHLISITERVQINGDEISEDEFARLATRVRETSEKLVESGKLESIPTFFEQVTAIALLAFAEANVELAILETGLGGRLDATTAANAEIAAITRIDVDHQQYLGETIEGIAAEKAAIIRENTLGVIVGEQQPAAGDVIYQRAWALGLRPMASAKVWTKEVGPGRYEFIDRFGDVTLGLRGRHQLDNAKIAILILEELLELADKNQIPLVTDHVIEIEEVVRGLESARHPGRLETIDRFLLDGAHNSGGAQALRDYLDEFVQRPITMIFGAMNDKNTREILSILSPAADNIILTQADSPRSRSTADLERDLPESYDRRCALVTENVANALKVAKENSRPSSTILITGSLYLVGEARRLLKSQI